MAEGAEALVELLIDLAGEVAAVLPDLCTYGLTLGDSFVPFDPDPEDECDEEFCQNIMWVRVEGYRMESTTGREGFDENCSMQTVIDLEVGVYRCIEVPDGGEAPTASAVLEAAAQALEDTVAMKCALTDFADSNASRLTSLRLGAWSPLGPLGGQAGGMWTASLVL